MLSKRRDQDRVHGRNLPRVGRGDRSLPPCEGSHTRCRRRARELLRGCSARLARVRGFLRPIPAAGQRDQCNGESVDLQEMPSRNEAPERSLGVVSYRPP